MRARGADFQRSGIQGHRPRDCAFVARLLDGHGREPLAMTEIVAALSSFLDGKHFAPAPIRPIGNESCERRDA